VQGELDFRCTIPEGLGLFTALRRQGVPARLVYFPDEGHWVLKPRNREVWWREVLGWLESHLRD
jgi:dipeptidyl aminopeptidase/acylaminoacyl peptidase